MGRAAWRAPRCRLPPRGGRDNGREEGEAMSQAREIVLTFVDDGVSARAVLLEDEAPRTCRTIWGLLPLRGEAIHAAYSGTLAALYFDPTVAVPEENATPCLQTGDVVFTHY